MIQAALKDSFGLMSRIEPIDIKGLPLFMISGRAFYKLTCEGVQFLIVELSADDKFGIVALKKQATKYKDTTGLDVIYAFKHVTKAQRDALVSNKISFICLPSQIYLPILGLSLRNLFKNIYNVNSEKMMPITQSLFLHLLYKDSSVKKSDAASYLGVTKTSITRASAQLKAMGLIKEKRVGTEIYMNTVAKGFELFTKAKPYLINPKTKVITTSVKGEYGELPQAGESALSGKSMLASPKSIVYAIFKDSKLAKECEIVDPKWAVDKPYCEIELWKYDPMLFAINGSVDIISLAMSLSDNEDERVQYEINKYLEEYRW